MQSTALKRVLVTAGPTRESLDPVRYLSNQSTGEMGYAVAREARRRGYRVTLISGPVALKPLAGVKMVYITSAAQLQKACEKYFPQVDALIMSAAVCDFRPRGVLKHKMKRTGVVHVRLEKTPDILSSLAANKNKQLVIGFCLETEHWLSRARHKLARKKLDGIVANRLTSRYSPFGRVKASVAFVDRDFKTVIVKSQSKNKIAYRLLNWLDFLQSQKAIQKK